MAPPNRLRELRESYELSLEEVGLRTDIHFSALSRYERGLRNIPDQHKLALSNFYEVSVAHLMGWPE